MKEKYDRIFCLGYVLINIVFSLIISSPVFGAGAGYSEYYIPGDEVYVYEVLEEIGANSQQGTNGDMHSVISVTAWERDTILYYDHWENGYDFDPDDPDNPGADEVYVFGTRGASRVFESSNIPALNRGTTEYYDGRDRLYIAGAPVTVTRAAWTESAGTLLSVAWEVYPIRPQLTTYILPFGEDLAPGLNDFERVYGFIQATEDNTVVTVDLDKDGIPDLLDTDRDGDADGTSVTLDKGEVFLLDRVSAFPETTYFYDFATAQGFTIGAADGTPAAINWELNDPTDGNDNCDGSNCYGGGPDDDHTAGEVNCWGTNIDGMYANNINPGIYLYSPEFDFTGQVSVEISFWQWLEVLGQWNGGDDIVSFQYSDDGGSSWNDIWVYGDTESYRWDGGWSQFTHDASTYSADTSQVQWRWMLETDGDYQMGGWYIDDVEVVSRTVATATLNTGTTIKSNKTVQVQYIIGDEGSNYEIRGLSAFPRGFWDDEYYAPVDGPAAADDPVDLYLYNPHTDDLTIYYETQTASGSFTIDPKTSSSFEAKTGFYVPEDTAVYLRGSDVFWGVSTIDVEATTHDWGYSLVPAFLLRQEHFMGWAPGYYNDPNDPITITSAHYDNSGVYAAPAQDNVRLFVDYDNDGTADDTYDLARLQSQYLYDSNDGDMSNANIYATGPYVLAYGQNPDLADAAEPSIDVGYTTLPATDFIELVLSVDKTVDQYVFGTAAGTQATFTLVVSSHDFDIDDINVKDTLPPGWEYVDNSTTITLADKSQVTGNAADPTDITGQNLTWDDTLLEDMNANQEIVITYDAEISAPTIFSAGDLSRNFVEAVGSRTVEGVTQTFVSTDFVFITYIDIEINKTSDGKHPLSPGDQFEYTITVTNPAGAAADLTGISIYDPIPNGVSYVANSSYVDVPYSASTKTVGDDFGTVSYSGGSGTWATDWQEIDESTTAGANGGEVYISGGELWIQRDNNPAPGIQREVDFTGYGVSAFFEFDYRTTGGVDNNDSLTVQISDDGGSNWTVLETFTGFSGTTNGSREYDISNYISDATRIRFQTANDTYGGDNENFIIDNVEVRATSAGDGSAGDPPNFIHTGDGYDLSPGETLTLTFEVTVDNPLASGIDEIVNTACVGSKEFLVPVCDSVTNIVSNPSSGSASVGDRVWFDVNGDGIQDVGEPGIANVQVTLKDEFGTPVESMTMTTDINGYYLFTGVEPGIDYYVHVTGGLPSGLVQSSPHSPPDEDNKTDPFDLIAGDTYLEADLGYETASGTATLGDRVWHDADGDGIQDPGEPGLGGVTVYLYEDGGDGIFDGGTGDDTLYTSVTTGTAGLYYFTGIPADGATDYWVFVDETQTGPTDLSNNFTATTANQRDVINLAAGNVQLFHDFGFQYTSGTPGYYNIKDRVWFDEDDDEDDDNSTTSDNGETGIKNVTVDLLDASLTVIATTTTDADGYFEFTGIEGGGADYTIRITDRNGQLTDYYGTTTEAVAGELEIDNLNADIDYTTEETPDTNEPNFGYNLVGTIGDTVFLDIAGGTVGVQDSGEPGIGGITVVLYKDDGDDAFEFGTDTQIASLVTDSDGNYLFSGLDDNATYFVYIDNGQSALTGLSLSSTDDDTASGHQQKETIDSGSGQPNSLDADFGYIADDPHTVSGTIWEDNIGDGVIGAGENGFENVTVELWDGGTLIMVTSTNVSGYYEFIGVPERSYTVRVTDDNSILTDYQPTYEKAVGTSGPFDGENPADTTAGGGTNVADVNFGFFKPVPTYIVLTSFTAYEDNGYVIVEWETATQIGTLGFEVVRLNAYGDLIHVTERPVPALISPLGGIYQCFDRLAEIGETYTYQLVELEASGRKRIYGPYTVHIRKGESAYHSDDDRSALLNNGYFRQPRELFRRQEQPVVIMETSTGQSASGEWKVSQGSLGFNVAARSLMVTAPIDTLTGIRELKIKITDAGLYKVEAADMAAALNVFEDDVIDVIANGQIRMSNLGKPVAYFPAGENSGIYFYGQSRSSIYTDSNVYWLELMPGSEKGDLNGDGIVDNQDFEICMDILTGRPGQNLRADYDASGADVNGNARVDMAEAAYIQSALLSVMGTVSGDMPYETAEGKSFASTVHFEKQVYFKTDLPVDVEDFWFWEKYTLGFPEYGSYPEYYPDFNPFQIEINEVAPGSSHVAELTVKLQGFSNHPHLAKIILNVGTAGELYLGEVSWNGYEPVSQTFLFNQQQLTEGLNTIKIESMKKDDAFGLDSFDLAYQRLYNGSDDSLILHSGENELITVDGFTGSDIYVFDLTNPDLPKRVVNTAIDTVGNRVTMIPSASETPYLALLLSAAKKPASEDIVADEPSDLKNAANAAAYLIITADELSAGAKALETYRTSKFGVSTKLVKLSDVFDEFSYGVYDPYAIKNFIEYAVNNWDTPPQYVVLVGHGTFDYKQSLEKFYTEYFGSPFYNIINLMPVVTISTPFGEYTSDNFYGDVTGDGMPDLAIGRIPAKTETEVLDYVTKLSSYESAPSDNHVMMLADVNPDPGPFNNFSEDSDDVISEFSGDYEFGTLYYPGKTTIDMRDGFINSLKNGIWLVNYIGHGTYDAMSNFYYSSDVGSLANTQYPIYVAMTCLAGDFSFPMFDSDSLSEKLVSKSSGGMIASWSPTGLSINSEAVKMNKKLFEAMLETNDIGNAVKRSIELYKADGEVPFPYMIGIYNLLGDPALETKLIK